MAGSKFVEILNSSDAPFSHANVTLDDVLAEEHARARGPRRDSAKSSSPDTELKDPIAAVPKPRGFSLKKVKT